MYKTIMMPVDLDHRDRLDKALQTAGDLARHYEAEIVYVGLAASVPSKTGMSPKVHQEKLEALAAEQGAAHGRPTRAKTITSPDPAADLDRVLAHTVNELQADLVIMASHAPSFRDLFFGSNASHVVSHTSVSIFVVR